MTTLAFSRVPITVQSDGRILVAVYHAAQAISSSIPLVIMCHGFGGDKSGRGRVLVSLSEILSKAGIASLRFDFLGSGDSEGSLSDVTPSACIQNLLDIVQAVPKECGPIGLFGRSYGGYICLQAAASLENVVAIAVDAPPFGGNYFSSPPPLFQEVDGQLFFLGEPMAKDFLRQMQQLDTKAALERLVNVPLLHISCEKDQVISQDQTNKFKEIRKRAQAQTRFFCIAGADHGCSLFSHRKILLKEISEWFVAKLMAKKTSVCNN